MDIKESIEKTKNGFEKSFHEQRFYKRQTADKSHLEKIVDFLDIKDDFMQMKKDGHIKFYTIEEIKNMSKKHGLKFEKGFETSIRFPKKISTAAGFNDILKKHNKKVIDSYDLKIIEDEIYITERVYNLSFIKERR